MPVYRFQTWHALTGQLLASHVPLSDVEISGALNASGSLSGTLAPGFAHLTGRELDPGNTVLSAERDGKLLWGGLVWRAEPEGATYPVEAAGWGSYLHRRHDLHGQLGGRGPYVNADPCTVIRDAWAYAQEQPDSNLGVQVDSTTSRVTVGTPADPYRTDWWEAPVLGRVVDDMASIEGGPQWAESTGWSSGRPAGRIRLGWPRLGSRRSDIAFATGVNIASVVPVEFDADAYAQVVIALGAGEGRSRRRAIDAVRNGRLRLEHVLEAPEEKGTDRLADRARAERRARQVLGEITQINVIDHPAAPVGSWQIGDDVRVTVHDTWADFDGWCRITGWALRPPHRNRPEQITLTLARSDRYTYGS
ncbi:hypothetical protein CIB93_14035 [Streptomyces sp. WZ.A104]|uniref:hypothetical protein n=1 Tax=Streptomyces sp. WZ.A104 TaxID=2023771 RepID=UPI000BBC24CE|nr:hypothetical protein [Streptomyces sp. WZ.A104]PCG85470.1 hypothetical protein CIB93_14035 [Streptomyces sp. WZ.A104]